MSTLTDKLHPRMRRRTARFAAWLCAAGVGLVVFPVSGDEQDASDHGYRSLFRDHHWFTLPGTGTSSGESLGLYHEQWKGPEHFADEGDHYTGMRHRFAGGLGLDTGLARYDLGRPRDEYREFYFGLSYDAVEGRVWYTDDYLGSGNSRSFYEFGVSGRVSGDVSLSARVGYGSDAPQWLEGQPRPSFILSAEKRDLYGFGLNLQLSGSEDTRLDALDDVRVMGILSRPIP